jgi:hypothetical protein
MRRFLTEVGVRNRFGMYDDQVIPLLRGAGVTARCLYRYHNMPNQFARRRPERGRS